MGNRTLTDAEIQRLTRRSTNQEKASQARSPVEWPRRYEIERLLNAITDGDETISLTVGKDDTMEFTLSDCTHEPMMRMTSSGPYEGCVYIRPSDPVVLAPSGHLRIETLRKWLSEDKAAA